MQTISKCVAIAGVSAGIAMTPVPAMAFSPAPPPERQTESMEVECYGRVVRLTLQTDRLGITRIGTMAVNGRVVNVSALGQIRAFLAEVRGANIAGINCVSDTQVSVAIWGSRLDTSPGEEDDVLEMFPVDIAASR